MMYGILMDGRLKVNGDLVHTMDFKNAIGLANKMMEWEDLLEVIVVPLQATITLNKKRVTGTVVNRFYSVGNERNEILSVKTPHHGYVKVRSQKCLIEPNESHSAEYQLHIV